MAGSSNRDLWQVVTGHSALRDHALIEKEVRDFLPRLQVGVAYYRPSSPEAEERLREKGRVRANKLDLVLDLSAHLQLDQEQALELFEGYLISAHRGTLGELEEAVRSEGGRREVVTEVTTYYHSERLHLLRCIKHILGFWQDPNHPFRDVYTVCIDEVAKDEKSFVQSLWQQYGSCVDDDLPSQLTPGEERQWVVQRLAEQVELLEAILLYYKDFIHSPSNLLLHARQLHEYGFGLRQTCRVSLVEGADVLQRHIGHLCSLILVESLDLDYILANIEDHSALQSHHLLKTDSSTIIQGLDALFSEWGNQDCHTPVLLSWALVQFATEQSTDTLEAIRLLGNRALSGGVFEYMRSLLNSPFFSKERPVAGVCKSVLHTLISLALTQFSEDSLGDYQDLVAIATETLTHPPLRLQSWDQGLSVGVGVLINSALSHFPYLSSPLSSLLVSLAGDEVGAGHVWNLLDNLHHFTEQLPTRAIGKQVCMVTGEEGAEPGLVVEKPRSFYGNEAQWLGCQGVVMAAGVRGEMWEGWGGESLVSWSLPGLSGWTLLALETVRLLHTTPLDTTTEELVTRVTGTVHLVMQMMKSDWSLAAALYPITTQFFSMLQRFSVVPRPPCTLLASCLSCMAVMATKNTAEAWSALGQTGFLPYLISSHTSISTEDLDHVRVCPGHYGQLLKMVECPQGLYPVSMAMLDLLATTCLPGNSVVSREQLASVVYVMREVFMVCNKWKYRLRGDKDELELKLLKFCHDTLNRHRATSYSLGVVITTHLLRCPGERGVLPLLSLPVTTLDTLHSAALGTLSVSPCVESVRLSLAIVDHLLHISDSTQTSLLEWNLANTYPHIVSNISSYIYHHGDTRIPIAATALLTHLCQAAPLSVFAALGSDAVAKRDAFVTRLASHVEEEDLKYGILCLLREAVTSQPALAELFLCIHSCSKKGQVQYSLREASCLHPVLKIIASSHHQQNGISPLLPPSLHLLHSLWHGRHDAVLHALRGTPSFWKHVATPILRPPDYLSNEQTEVTNQLLAAGHVMHIIAMEIYYVIRDRLDTELEAVLREFISNKGIKNWNQCLQFPVRQGETTPQPLTSVLLAQRQLVTGWKTLLMVASSNQPSLFGLSPSSPSSPLSHILTDILAAIESHLAAPVSKTTVAIATELSLLMMVLIKRQLPVASDLIGQFSDVLAHVVRLDAVEASPLTLHLYTCVHLLLGNARTKKVSVGTRFLLGLIPFLAHTLRCRHDNSKGPSHRPDVAAMSLLSEMVVGVSDWLPWLQAFRNESLIPLMLQLVEERLKLQSDEPLIEAILGVFITMATSPVGAESLLMSGLLQVLSLPLCSCLDSKLNPSPLTSQPPGTPVLKPHPPAGWSSVWELSVRVAGLVCHALPHLSLPALLDFTGAHQHRLTQALDIMEAIHSLQTTATTRSCVFFIQQLFRHRRQLAFSLPAFHNTATSCTLTLLAAIATVLSRRATLRHIVKTMLAAGLLPSNYGPPPAGKGHIAVVDDELWTAGSRLSAAFTKLQSDLLSILSSCLCTIQHFSPTLSDVVMATGQLERDEYPPLFQPVLIPPTLDQTTPPSLGALTTCLSVGLDMLKKLGLDPHKIGTPSKSKSPSKSPRPPLSPGDQLRQRQLLAMMERAAALCMGQTLCLLADHTLSLHDRQLLCKELTNELGSSCHGLLLWFNRRGVPASQATPTAYQEVWSGKSTLTFTETREQIVFRITDSFSRQLLNLP